MSETEVNFKKYVVWFWGVVLALLFVALLFFFLLSKGLLGFMPSFEELENPKNILASEMLSADNKILDKYFIRENRSYVDYKDIPPHLVDALISVEDVRFYRHSGIDLRGLLRVFKGLLLSIRHQEEEVH
jgi:penicillin-binding protein 1A